MRGHELIEERRYLQRVCKIGLACCCQLTLVLAGDRRAEAVDVVYSAPKSQTLNLPGAWAAVAPTTANPVRLSDFYNDGTNFSYPVFLDTGSSGMLMSATVQMSFSVPLIPGATYEDVGIGGTETFNVTQNTQVRLAPTNVDPDTPANFSSFGNFKIEAKQPDPLLMELLGIPELYSLDIVGTPVLKNRVMHVYSERVTDLVSSGGAANLMEAHLLNTMPTGLPAQGVLRVPVVYQNFVTGSPLPSMSLNPVIQGVTARAEVGAPGFTSDWLLDSGASASIVTQAMALQIGIDLSSPPLFKIDIFGVGLATVTLDAYELAELSLPMTTGDRLVFQNAVVFVPETTSLPAGLTGVLGSNLFGRSFNQIDMLSGQPLDEIPSLFSEWYLNSLASDLNQLILVDPTSSYVPGKPGDANRNGSVDGNDLTTWLANFTGPGSFGAAWSQGDFNYDGAVDGNDLTIWLANFTGPGGAFAGLASVAGDQTSVVPEPGMLGLLAIGTLGLLAHRRRR